ncbi:signal peptidase complex catalytic subunit SEC11C-like [Panicum virgatum]|uniref:Signal peptidase complex catalytic subunit SEC11 n=1 Tax=Panicum virgatum TaxID=38727 RepID=A0A8T0VSI1_PANVG|nr:signal peptidase complex catalytic subunit SEC11C-like [Panicum virgatum]KAG2634509.1 hypothetical protein PVAP13_2NG228400 [Panicum virgatum]
MAYTAVTAATGAEFSSRVALTSSMEPAIERGDLLLFRKGGGGDPIRAGDVVLFKPARDDIPVVHCVIEVHERREDGGGGGGVDILTKGDNNGVDNSEFLYNEPWLHRHHVMAKAVGYLPNAGWPSIAMYEKPVVRKVIVGVLGLGVLVTALL